MNSTPEEKGCQASTGKNVDICKAIASQYSDKEAEKAREILALANNPQEKERAEVIIKEATGTKVVLDTSKAVCRGGITPSELNSIVEEISGKPVITPVSKVVETCNQSNETPAKKKSIEESRKLIDTFKEKLGSYPRVLTYEGSVVLCVALSINEGNGINLNGLPQVDREMILSQLPSNALSKMVSFNEAHLNVEFDNTKDFVLIYKLRDAPPLRLNFFNTVIHPQNLPDTNVPVEQDGGKVMVGNSLVLDQKRIQKLIGVVPPEKSHRDDDNELPRRQPVSGRNAFELRTDILTLAVDWVGRSQVQKTEGEVMRVAKLFYSFVENRR